MSVANFPAYDRDTFHQENVGHLNASVLLDLPCLNRGGVRSRRVSIGRVFGIGLETAKENVAQVRRDNSELVIVARFTVDL